MRKENYNTKIIDFDYIQKKTHTTCPKEKRMPRLLSSKPLQNMVATLVAIACLAMISSAANAVALLSEDFTYADGALGGQNGGTGFGAAWTGAATQVTSGEAVIAAGTCCDAFRDLPSDLGTFAAANTVTVGELWGGIDYLQPVGDTFGGLSFFAPTAGGPGNRTERMLLGDGFNQDVWGVSAPGHGIFNSTVANDDVARRGVFQIVFNEFGDETVNLWVGSNTTAPVVIITGSPVATGNFELSDANSIRLSHGAGGASFDNFVIGETAADVGGVVDVPPTPTVLGDVNDNGTVGLEDFGLIRDNFRTSVGFSDFSLGDISGPTGDRDFFVDFYDFNVWATEYEATGGSLAGLSWSPVPEPTSALLAILGIGMCALRSRRA